MCLDGVIIKHSTFSPNCECGRYVYDSERLSNSYERLELLDNKVELEKIINKGIERVKMFSFPSFPEKITIREEFFVKNKKSEERTDLKKTEEHIHNIREIAEKLGITNDAQNKINRIYTETFINGIHNHSVNINIMLMELETYYEKLKKLRDKEILADNNEKENKRKKNKLLETLNYLITRDLPTKERLYSVPRVDNLEEMTTMSESLKQLDDIFLGYRNLDYDLENYYFPKGIINKLREILVDFNLSEIELKAFLFEQFRLIRKVNISNSMFIINSLTNVTHNLRKYPPSSLIYVQEKKDVKGVSVGVKFSEDRKKRFDSTIEIAKKYVNDYAESKFQKKLLLNPKLSRIERKNILEKIRWNHAEYFVINEVNKGLEKMRCLNLPSYLEMYGPDIDDLNEDIRSILSLIIDNLRTIREISYRYHLETEFYRELNGYLRQTIKNISNNNNDLAQLKILLSKCNSVIYVLRLKINCLMESKNSESIDFLNKTMLDRHKAYHNNLRKKFIESSDYISALEKLKNIAEETNNEKYNKDIIHLQTIIAGEDLHYAISEFYRYSGKVISEYEKQKTEIKEREEKELIKTIIGL